MSIQRRFSQIQKCVANPKAVELISTLITVLQIQDEKERLKALLPLVHKSLLFESPEGLVLTRSIKEYSYRKAVSAASAYSTPVRVTEVHRGKTLTLGAGAQAERGRIDKYFIQPNQMMAAPVPVGIFWPEGSETPFIENFGSL